MRWQWTAAAAHIEVRIAPMANCAAASPVMLSTTTATNTSTKVNPDSPRRGNRLTSLFTSPAAVSLPAVRQPCSMSSSFYAISPHHRRQQEKYGTADRRCANISYCITISCQRFHIPTDHMEIGVSAIEPLHYANSSTQYCNRCSSHDHEQLNIFEPCGHYRPQGQHGMPRHQRTRHWRSL